MHPTKYAQVHYLPVVIDHTIVCNESLGQVIDNIVNAFVL